MKKTFNIVLAVITLFTLKTVKAQGVDAYFYVSPFYAPGYGVYVENYIAIAGNSVHYMATEDSTLQASVQITLLFKNADEIQEYRTYKIVSPPLQTNTKVFPSFIDLQRILIPSGVYNYELIIHDNYGPDSLPDFKATSIVSVNIPEDETSLSGIQFLERFRETSQENIYVKSGYECVPYVSDFFPKEMDYMRLYLELYNASKDIGPLEDFLFLVQIEQQNTGKPIKDFSSFTKQKAMNVNVLIKEMDIRKLPSGNYYLVVEVRNRNNELVVSERKFFQRSNNIEETNTPIAIEQVSVTETFASKFVNADSLRFAIRSLSAICDPVEARFINTQVNNVSLKVLQQFFYTFWSRRNEENPANEWNKYWENVLQVQIDFGSKQVPGYATDRGRVYLQYGSPNSIISEKNESGAYPYEIWHYYKIADQTNKKFIFYNPDLMGSNYILLHSDMKGEINNSNWLNELYARGGKPGKAKRLFEGR